MRSAYLLMRIPAVGTIRRKPNYIYDVTVSKTGSSWLPASTHYWPGNAYKLKFFAYAPQNNNAYQLSGQIAGTPTVTCTIPDNVAEQQDLLVAASEEINGGTNTAVNLRFRHALTAVKFVCGSDMKAGTVKSVTLKGMNSTGVYNFETDTWSHVSNPKNFSQTLNQPTSGTPNTAITAPEQTFMMIPQTLPDNAVIEVVFNDGVTDNILTGRIGKSVWQMGKTVTYQLSSTSINWQYILTVSSETLNFNYLGGTQSYSVTSYRKNNQGIIEPVEWTPNTRPTTERHGVAPNPAGSPSLPQGEREAKLPLPLTLKLLHKPVYPKVYIRQPFVQQQRKVLKPFLYNLSNSTGAARRGKHANCYVVNAPGTYSFPFGIRQCHQ